MVRGKSGVVVQVDPDGRHPITQGSPPATQRLMRVEGNGNIVVAILLLVLGTGAAATALLGPLVAGIIRYRTSEGAIDQIVGGDVAALLLVFPISFLAGVLVWRGHRAGPVLALSPAAYALYMYSQLALGGDVFRYEGNSDKFFPLYLGLFVLSGFIAVRSWSLIDRTKLPSASRRLTRAIGFFLLVVALFLAFGLHLPGLIDAWSAEPSSTEYLADPVVFWLVKFMDLAMVVPVLAVVGIGLIRRSARLAFLRYAAIGWSALLGSSVAGMALMMQLNGDPAGTLANTIAFGAFALIGLVLAALVHRPLFETP